MTTSANQICWEEVLELVKAADESGGTIKGQKVLFMLGFTGAGKTTTLLYLEGKELVAGPNESVVLKHPEEEEKWKISKNNSKSETRFISAKQLDGIVAVDAAGLEDTEGPSVELANLYSITSTLQLCESVIPVLVINYYVLKSDRGQYLRKLFTYIGKLFNKNSNILYDSLTVLITKAPPRTNVEEFGDKLKEILESGSAANSDEFNTVAGIILDTIEENAGAVSFVNPLKPRERTGLWKKILQRKPVENPGKMCKFSMTNELEVELRRALNQIQLDIPDWVEKGNIDKLLLHLELFKVLHTKLQILAPAFNNMVTSVQEIAKKKQNEVVKRYQEFLDTPTSRNEEDIRKINELVTLLEQLEQVRSFLTNDILTTQVFQTFVLKGIETLCSHIKNEAKDFFRLNNIFQQIKFCEELVPFIGELKNSDYARKEIAKKIDKLHEIISTTNFKEYTTTTLATLQANISTLKSAYSQVSEIIDDSFPSIEDCKAKFMANFSSIYEKTVSEIDSVTKEEFTEPTKLKIQIFKDFSNNPTLCEEFPDVPSLYPQLQDQIRKKVQEKLNQIKSDVKINDRIAEFESPFEEVTSLLSLDNEVRSEGQSAILQLIFEMDSKLKLSMEVIEKELLKSPPDYAIIKQKIELVQKNMWLDRLSKTNFVTCRLEDIFCVMNSSLRRTCTRIEPLWNI